MLQQTQMKATFKNILLGAASIASIFPVPTPPVIRPLYKPHASDAEAIRSDWEAVGRDLRSTMDRIGHVK